jgi:hemerythrin
MTEWAYGVAWSDDLETGNDAIDYQHKQLFKLTSDLVEACEKKKGDGILGEALDFLASYTVKHFVDEEALQVEHKYPGYENHKKLHEDFKAKVVEMIDQYKTNNASVDLRAQVNTFIIRWLLQHIKREDFKIAEHIRKTTAGR